MVPRKKYQGAAYVTRFICTSSLKEHARLAASCMRTISAPYDTIAFSGMSGAMIGPILAMRLGKEMVLVRKPKDDTHSSHKVEGYPDVTNYIIVDDFTCTGDTAERIQREMYKFAPNAKCLGVVPVQELYEHSFDMDVYERNHNLTEEELRKG